MVHYQNYLLATGIKILVISNVLFSCLSIDVLSLSLFSENVYWCSHVTVLALTFFFACSSIEVWSFVVIVYLCCNLPHQVLEKEAFQKQMLEKLIWISAFMLVGARHPGATVGVVEKDYRSEVCSVMTVLQPVQIIGYLSSNYHWEERIFFQETELHCYLGRLWAW